MIFEIERNGVKMAGKNLNADGDRLSNGSHPLEFELKKKLKPITANPDYIQRLKAQLRRVPTIMVENKPRITGLLMIFLSLFSSVFIIWILRKISKQ